VNRSIRDFWRSTSLHSASFIDLESGRSGVNGQQPCPLRFISLNDFSSSHIEGPKARKLASYFSASRPTLCRKTGVPRADVRGNITSHRGRSTIASQLFNAKEPMTLFELQEWLGHSTPAATQHYAKITPTKLAKSYADAGYFKRNLRAIEVLVDQETVRSGRAANEPWKFYDLGHGFCMYDFFEQCPHRMACAKCTFYMPKGSSQAQLIEGKANLLRLR
jgi:hypothetical protein